MCVINPLHHLVRSLRVFSGSQFRRKNPKNSSKATIKLFEFHQYKFIKKQLKNQQEQAKTKRSSRLILKSQKRSKKTIGVV